MSILLTRHGETDWNIVERIQGKTDIPLNETGKMQAEKLAEMIYSSEYDVKAVYTCSLARAKSTAEKVAEKIGVCCYAKTGLEELDLGDWEGITWNEVKERYSKEYWEWKANRRYGKTLNGESYQDVLDRVLPVLVDINREGENVLVVTHSAVILAILLYINNVDFSLRPKEYIIGNAELVCISDEEIARIGEIR